MLSAGQVFRGITFPLQNALHAFQGEGCLDVYRSGGQIESQSCRGVRGHDSLLNGRRAVTAAHIRNFKVHWGAYRSVADLIWSFQ